MGDRRGPRSWLRQRSLDWRRVGRFAKQDIRPRVLIWHAELDANDRVAMARAQERRVPHGAARCYGGEGHLIFFSRIDEILAELAER